FLNGSGLQPTPPVGAVSVLLRDHLLVIGLGVRQWACQFLAVVGWRHRDRLALQLVPPAVGDLAVVVGVIGAGLVADQHPAGTGKRLGRSYLVTEIAVYAVFRKVLVEHLGPRQRGASRLIEVVNHIHLSKR